MPAYTFPEQKFRLLRCHGESVNFLPTHQFNTYQVTDPAWNARLDNPESHAAFQKYITELLGVTNVTTLQRGEDGVWQFQTLEMFS